MGADTVLHAIGLHDGRTLTVFVNRDTNLLVVDVIDADEDGGVEIVRRTLPPARPPGAPKRGLTATPRTR